MAGPTDTANWLIPGLVLMGSYLEGKARRRGRQPSPPDAIGACLLSGIGTFVVLMAKKEVSDLQVENKAFAFLLLFSNTHARPSRPRSTLVCSQPVPMRRDVGHVCTHTLTPLLFPLSFV